MIDIIKITKQWHVPDEYPKIAPQRMDMPILGTLSNAVNDLYWRLKAKETDFNKDKRKEWQRREEIGVPSVLEKMKQLGKQNIDDSFIGTMIEYLSEFDMVGEIKMKELSWCGGFVKNISDGTWVKPGKYH